MHNYEAVYVMVRRVWGEDGFCEVTSTVVAGARFAARGDTTAFQQACEREPGHEPGTECEVRVYRVLDGVRSHTSTADDYKARARQFGRRRFA